MMSTCQAPIADAKLLDYWSRDLPDGPGGDEMNGFEEHLFACGDCSARLNEIAALGAGLATLARQGRVSGIVSRAVLNRLQRDGARVRMYWLAPGETIPCAVYPGDDVVVTALRADFSGVETVTLVVTGPAESPFGRFDDVPVSGARGEVLWANPAARLNQMPSMRLQLTLTSTGAAPVELGRYVLEHSATLPPV
jgi:hypothetical protein